MHEVTLAHWPCSACISHFRGMSHYHLIKNYNLLNGVLSVWIESQVSAQQAIITAGSHPLVLRGSPRGCRVMMNRLSMLGVTGHRLQGNLEQVRVPWGRGTLQSSLRSILRPESRPWGAHDAWGLGKGRTCGVMRASSACWVATMLGTVYGFHDYCFRVELD